MIRLKDKLSHLGYRQACKLLGSEGDKLILRGGKYDIDLDEQVTWGNELFSLGLGEAVATIALNPEKNGQLDIQCSTCINACEHMGALLSLVLEEKTALGLAAPPPERVPLESLSDEQLVAQAVEERVHRAQTEKMRVKSVNPDALWTDYIVTNATSGKSYRVALRGWQRGESYCSCPDYRKNTLGTCKHILHVSGKVQRKFKKAVRDIPYQCDAICLYMRYGKNLELRMLMPEKVDPRVNALLQPLEDKPIEDCRDLLKRIKTIQNLGEEVIVYPDAEQYLNRELYLQRVEEKVAEIRHDPKNHPLRTSLLNTDLLPYQLDGIAFAVGAGRAIIADDMGLGKTIQGIGTAELLSQDADISKVLVICPASLKSQWRLEIEKSSRRSCHLVMGSASERVDQYEGPSFFTVCNYEQVLKDLTAIERVNWDLIILDEGQRIKNWETKTSRIVKSLRSPFALVLTGTPIENRLDDLYSIVEFIDDRRLGPAFRFFNRHRVVDEKGKLLGYKNLDKLRQSLNPILIRRTRSEVLDELPARSTEIRRIPPTDEQLYIHNSHKRIISAIISKKYISEMDLLRLQKALLMCRMAADSTYLVDKTPPGYSSKLEEIDGLIDQLTAEQDRKVVLFSEWTTMLNLIEPLLTKRRIHFVRLDGSVPQKKRQGLIHQFRQDSKCQFFVATNAGSTGLNLQAANTVINVDLPWNPAVLEQRIGRAHRMGQKRPVQVFLLITEQTLEESLLATLSAKQALFLAALDPDSEETTIDMAGGMEELKRRLEILLGEKPAEAIDESRKAEVEKTTQALERSNRIQSAGGQLLEAVFAFVNEILPEVEETEQTLHMTNILKNHLGECLERDEGGNLRMTVRLSTETALDNIAKSLAKMVSIQQR